MEIIGKKRVLLTDEVILAGASVYTEGLSLINVDGAITVVLSVTGSGTCTLDYECGLTPSDTYVIPGVAGDQGSLATALVGGGAEYIWQDILDYSELVRFKVTEASGVANITVTLWVYVR